MSLEKRSMIMRTALVAGVLLAAGCNQAGAPAGEQSEPQLEAPTLETEPSRVFAATNEAATAATAQLTVSIVQRMRDAGADGDNQEVMTLTGANGVIVEAQIDGVAPPATQVQGQTLRALLAIPVEEPQVLVYRVTAETKADGHGICGADAASHFVVWEPSGPGDPIMKVLAFSGGGPGDASARACQRLEYRRA